MDQAGQWLQYLADHPTGVIIAITAIAALAYLLNRKPKAVREADERLKKLGQEKARHYHQPRPPS